MIYLAFGLAAFGVFLLGISAGSTLILRHEELEVQPAPGYNIQALVAAKRWCTIEFGVGLVLMVGGLIMGLTTR